jgi:hypothetical protein
MKENEGLQPYIPKIALASPILQTGFASTWLKTENPGLTQAFPGSPYHI